ncbi:transglycosylase SLT domain-containing protein [bacterium]|nr:transglycosylase SLT domain-containing protein [bacterium]
MNSDYRERMKAARAGRNRMYAAARRVIAILLLLGLAAVLLLALNWRKLLSAQQKLRYGMVFEASRDMGRQALSRPDDSDLLGRYLDALVKEGNLGRAFYLADLYGAKGSDDNALLAQLRSAVLKSRAESLEQKVYDLRSDPVWEATADTPCQQVLRYLLGYRHALSGDWASARNEFAAIDPRKLAPALRPFRDYYLARAYRLAGTDEEKAQVEGLLTALIEGKDGADAGLQAKARYNYIAWLLSSDAAKSDERPALQQLDLLLAQQKRDAGLKAVDWALLRSLNAFADYFKGKSDQQESFRHAAAALTIDPADPGAEESGTLALDALAAALKGQVDGALDSGKRLNWELHAGFGPALAQCTQDKELLARFAGALRELHKAGLAKDNDAQVALGLAQCYRRLGDSARLKNLMTQVNLGGIDDSELGAVYWEYAELMQGKEQWNEALAYYKSCGKLAGEHQAEALYQCYHVLKEVQEPLNIDAAIGYLQQVVQQHSFRPGYAKAVEEYIPLLIHLGRGSEARQLAGSVLEKIETGKTGELDEDTALRLGDVCNFWNEYLSGASDSRGRAARMQNWNYYELARKEGLQPQAGSQWLSLSSGSGSMAQQGCEYLAGLGLADEALEATGGTDPAMSGGLLPYLRLRFMADTASTANLQDAATEVLESWMIQERAVLDYVLSQAYPQPFGEEVQAAASATGVDPALIYAIMKKESAFRQDNESWVGAEGLMQVMPGTVRFLIDARGLPADYFARRLEPQVNIRLGAEYIQSLAQQLGVDPDSDSGVRAILHCYNGGPANYQKWKGLYPNADPVLFTSVLPNEQNETYVLLVYKYYKIYKWLESQ